MIINNFYKGFCILLCMKSKFLVLGVIGIAVLVSLFFIFSGNGEDYNIGGDKLNVVVSILPQKAFVEAVGGDLVEVNSVIPKGASPATYSMNPSDLVLIENADIYFRIGHIPFEEANIHRIEELNSEMLVSDISENVNLRYFSEGEEHSHGEEHEEGHEEHEEHGEEMHHEDEEHEHSHEGVDPHVWLSLVEVKSQIDIIVDVLSNEDFVNSNIYFENGEKFKAELDLLHSELSESFSDLESDSFMVFHPAWGYFAREYGLNQIAIENAGKEPTAEELQHFIDEAREENVDVIFVQSQFDQNIARSIADEVGAVVVSIDPLSEDYLDNFRSFSESIRDSLNN